MNCVSALHALFEKSGLVSLVAPVRYNPFDFCSSVADYEKQQLHKHLRRDALERRLYLADKIIVNRRTAGFKVRRYKSGEMSGAMYSLGQESKFNPPARSGPIETAGFTVPARQKIKRAVENSSLPLNYFLTLTFAPHQLMLWQTEDFQGFNSPCSDFVGPFQPEILETFQGVGLPTVRHDYAKFRLHRFLDALTKHVQRKHFALMKSVPTQVLYVPLSYVWVAELQENGNIHYHILLNKYIPVAYYRRIWIHGRLNIKFLKDNNHAVNYMRKYMTKEGNATIKGNRYGICSELRESMRPEEEIICSNVYGEASTGLQTHSDVLSLVHAMRSEIEERGGIVLDFGFSCPCPRRSKQYLDKVSGKKRQTKGVHKNLADNVYQLISGEKIPF